MKHKKIVAFLAACSLVFGLCAYAVDLPHAFWSLNDSYNWAIQAGDNDGIIWYGTQITDLLRDEADSAEKNEIMASRLDQIALAYERKGQYPSAAQCYREYLPYADRMGWADGIKIANAKILQYTPELQLYTESNQTQKFYGAKNEHEQGILCGRTVRDEIKESLWDDSIVLVYANFGNEAELRWVEETLAEAQKTGTSVEVAWNFANEADDLQIQNKDAIIEQMTSVLNRYPDVKVFLRVGAEMNIWSNRAQPSQFVEIFRYISSKVKASTQNTALVWSVAHASSWDIDMEEYYPGDEYVDWVGISAYMMPYFQGREWYGEETFNEVVFSAGDSAEPVKLVNEVVSKFGDRKPILLAESGVAHHVRPLNRDTTEFAAVHMRRMYEYLPMVYPQIKGIVYFDKIIDWENNDYALSSNSTLEQLYYKEKQSPAVIKGREQEAGFIYKKLENTFAVEKSIFPVYAYAHVFGDAQPTVNYYLDGNWVAGGRDIPYKAEIDFSQCNEGMHTLRVVEESNGAAVFEREYNVEVRTPIKIEVNGELIDTDVPPTIQDDRTLVPLRVISEKLNAQVDWNAAMQRVAIEKDGKNAALKINSKVASVGDETVVLDVPAKILGGRTFVPVRAVASMLGADIGWDADTRTVTVRENF